MSKISLVVATLGRDKEVARLLNSISYQIFPAYEIIIVDQNEDDRVSRIVSKYQDLPIKIVKCSANGANYARNIGLKHSRGDIVSFPDDDCWYLPEVLYQVNQKFSTYEIGALSGRISIPSGGVSSGRWQDKSSLINKENVWITTVEFAAFFRREEIMRVGGFNESIGPGSKGIFGAHEIDDLFIRILDKNTICMYFPEILINHDEPISNYSVNTLKRAFKYGAGLGYVLKIYHYPFRILGGFVFRSLGGFFINLFFG